MYLNLDHGSFFALCFVSIWFYFKIVNVPNDVTHNLNFDLLHRVVFSLTEDDINRNMKQFKALGVLINSTFEHGIASGDPLSDSIILWTRVSPINSLDTNHLVSVYYKVATDIHFTNIVRKGAVRTNGYIDYTIKVDITGLEPDTVYYYRFVNEVGLESVVGKTRTLPTKDSIDSIKLAVYAGADYSGGYYHVYKFPVLKQSVDYVVHLGDYIYEYTNGEYTNGSDIHRDQKPEHECFTLEDYRERYALYKTDKNLQDSHSSFPWIVVWNNHELPNGGCINTKVYDYFRRKDAATQAYFEWLPIRPQLSKNYIKIWRSFKFGKLFHLNVLDTRHYAIDYYTNFKRYMKEYNDRTILGYDQEEWLQRELLENDTTWKFIMSQCVFNNINFKLPALNDYKLGDINNNYNLDAWHGYTQNRNRLLNYINNHDIKNTIILSGGFDIAIASEVSVPDSKYNVKTGEGSVLVEFTTSAVSSPSTFPKNLNESQSLKFSKELVKNNNLIWSDVYWRGYMEVLITESSVETTYYGTNVRDINSDEVELAKFHVKEGESRIYGSSVFNGALNPNFQ